MKSPLPRTSRISGLLIVREPREQMRALLGRALDQPFVEQHVERRERDRGRQRIAAERAAVIAGREHLHHVVGADERRHRQQAAAQRLAEDHAVGLHAVVLAREELAGAAHAGLDLVADQQHVALAADARALREIARRRHDDAAFALDRLDQERRGVAADRARERVGVAERNRAGSRGANGPKPSRYCGSDEKPTIVIERPWKLLRAHDDLGAVGGNALDLVAPLARGLERGLDRLGAAVRGQRAVEPGQLREPLEERAAGARCGRRAR